MDDWTLFADDLASRCTPANSRLHNAIASIPRHHLVPTWWEENVDYWVHHVGTDDPALWLRAAYGNRLMWTQINGRHADDTAPGTTLAYPRQLKRDDAASAVQPAHIAAMLSRLASDIPEGRRVLYVGIESGYGAAVLCALVGEEHVTGIGTNPSLVEKASLRLTALGMRPVLTAVDDPWQKMPGGLGPFDHVVTRYPVTEIPPSWLAALAEDGSLTVPLHGMGYVTAVKRPDGEAIGHLDAVPIPRDEVHYAPEGTLLRERLFRDGEPICHRPIRVGRDGTLWPVTDR